MLKLCIWMNIPSHYQSAFFEAVHQRDDVHLKVVYLNPVSSERSAEGWSDTHSFQPYELSLGRNVSLSGMAALLPDWRERIHLICGYFSADLVTLFCEQNIRWCHWSEMPGIRLAGLLGFRTPLFRLLNPLMLRCKQQEARRIREHALGAFGQGMLARKSFKRMGIPNRMIADLYYAPSGLEPRDPAERIKDFSNGRLTFLAVGALCRRKGIDIMLKALAGLKDDRACLVLCGLDKEYGLYQQMAEQLGLLGQVLFLGAWPVERIAEVYCASDVFVLPSRFDGWGVVLNEAASLGLPLIGSDLCGASWHIITHGKNGRRVRAGSVDSLCAAMRSYVERPERVAEEGRISQDQFAAHYTPECNATRLVTTLRNWGACEG